MRLDLKFELCRKFGSQIVAARKLAIREQRLSHLVRGHADPTDGELKAFRKAFGPTRVAELFKAREGSEEQRISA